MKVAAYLPAVHQVRCAVNDPTPDRCDCGAQRTPLVTLADAEAALAAHPAPSSDAALSKPECMPAYITPQMWQYRVEDTLKKFPSMSPEEAQRNAALSELKDLRKALKESHECRRELNSRIKTANSLYDMIIRQHAKDLAAHPANGAQADKKGTGS